MTAPMHHTRLRRRIAALTKARLARPAAGVGSGTGLCARVSGSWSVQARGQVAAVTPGHMPSGLRHPPSCLHRYTRQARRRPSGGRPGKLRNAPGMWSADRVCDQNSGDRAALVGGADATRANSSAVAAPADTPSTATDLAHPVRPRRLLADDGGQDGQRRRRLIGDIVLIGDGHPQMFHRGHPGTCGAQRGGRVRSPLRPDDEMGADPQGGGDGGELGPEGQRGRIGAEREDWSESPRSARRQPGRSPRRPGSPGPPEGAGSWRQWARKR